jgi:hypothetical protein
VSICHGHDMVRRSYSGYGDSLYHDLSNCQLLHAHEQDEAMRRVMSSAQVHTDVHGMLVAQAG